MSHQGGQESQPGYMDGICVKISEKYKPPPRINLAVSYAQRLSLNKQIQDNMQIYNFSLETNVKDCMKDLRNNRKLMLEEKREKLEKIRAARKKQAEIEAKSLESNTVKDLDNKSVMQCTCEASQVVSTDILYPSYSHILTPTPLVNNSTPHYSATDKSSFNIADFEADTSSPFDNCELKTINDIEELAQVLTKDKTYNQVVYNNYVPHPTTCEPKNYVATCDPSYNTYNIPAPTTSTSSYCQPVCTTYANLNGFYYSPNFPNYYDSSTKPIKSESASLKIKLSQNNVNKISKTLKDTHISSKQENVKCELDNTFELLPKNLQVLSQNISSMGFPLSRVAKVCQALGDDQKKVVEHLLVMSELLDLGFAETDVLNALIKCNNDRDKALDILIT